MRKSLSVACVVLLSASTGVFAQNWPHWRGPGHNGVSPESHPLPVAWSATEGVAWKLALSGYSGSTPIIWGTHVFLSVPTASMSGALELWAVHRADGRVLWKRPLAGGNHQERKQNVIAIPGHRRAAGVGDDGRGRAQGV
jgi:hypothetical protein